MTIQEIVWNYLDETRLAPSAFAAALAEKIPSADLSKAVIALWATGACEPRADLLTLFMLRYRDWRFDFGLACLSAKYPEIWGENSAVWKRVSDLLQKQLIVSDEEVCDRR